MRPSTLNGFVYVGNNPVKFKDPTGLYAALEDRDSSFDCWMECVYPRGHEKAGYPIPVPLPSPASYDPKASFEQAMAIGMGWLMEVGPWELNFGPDDPLTQDLMHDFGVETARRKWAAEGYRQPFVYNYHIEESGGSAWGVFFREQIYLLACMVGLYDEEPQGSVDMIGSALGSYDVFITDLGDGIVEIRVYNKSHWESFTRIPGTEYVLKSDNYRHLGKIERNFRPFGGGTTEQWFIWKEPKYSY